MATPEQIRRIADAEQRAVEAQAFVARGEQAIGEVRMLRDQAVAELRLAGWTQRRVAALLALTPAAVNKIDRQQGIRSAPTATQEKP